MPVSGQSNSQTIFDKIHLPILARFFLANYDQFLRVRTHIAKNLLLRLEAPRQNFFIIMEGILKNGDPEVQSREKMVSWLAEMARVNLKRAGMMANEGELAPLSMMLNILHVLQQMTSKIGTPKIDEKYIFRKTCRAKVRAGFSNLS